MQPIRLALSSVIALAIFSKSEAQWREGQPAVMTPVAGPVLEKPTIPVDFIQHYKTAGSPRMVLFWNKSFDDQLYDEQELQTSSEWQTHERDRASSFGSATQRVSVRQADKSKRHTPLSEREYTQLQAAFTQTLHAAGLRLIDRAAIMRITQIEKNKSSTDATQSGINAKAIEAEAMIAKTDLIMEILLIRDTESSIGLGFKISVKNIKQGMEVVSLYSLALPEVDPPSGEYVATDKGYEWRQPVAPTPSFADIGHRLAFETLTALNATL